MRLLCSTRPNCYILPFLAGALILYGANHSFNASKSLGTTLNNNHHASKLWQLGASWREIEGELLAVFCEVIERAIWVVSNSDHPMARKLLSIDPYISLFVRDPILRLFTKVPPHERWKIYKAGAPLLVTTIIGAGSKTNGFIMDFRKLPTGIRNEVKSRLQRMAARSGIEGEVAKACLRVINKPDLHLRFYCEAGCSLSVVVESKDCRQLIAAFSGPQSWQEYRWKILQQAKRIGESVPKMALPDERWATRRLGKILGVRGNFLPEKLWKPVEGIVQTGVIQELCSSNRVPRTYSPKCILIVAKDSASIQGLATRALNPQRLFQATKVRSAGGKWLVVSTYVNGGLPKRDKFKLERTKALTNLIRLIPKRILMNAVMNERGIWLSLTTTDQRFSNVWKSLKGLHAGVFNEESLKRDHYDRILLFIFPRIQMDICIADGRLHYTGYWGDRWKLKYASMPLDGKQIQKWLGVAKTTVPKGRYCGRLDEVLTQIRKLSHLPLNVNVTPRLGRLGCYISLKAETYWGEILSALSTALPIRWRVVGPYLHIAYDRRLANRHFAKMLSQHSAGEYVWRVCAEQQLIPRGHRMVGRNTPNLCTLIQRASSALPWRKKGSKLDATLLNSISAHYIPTLHIRMLLYRTEPWGLRKTGLLNLEAL